MTCFKKEIHDIVKVDVRSALLALVQREREGENVNHGLLKGIVEVTCPSSLRHSVELGRL